MQNRFVKTSKFLSLVLRHQPEKIGLKLDAAGWVQVDQLLEACRSHGFSLTKDELDAVVANNDKQRFTFSEDGLRIRANQGHSIEVELGYQPVTPPDELYHGTVERFLRSILESGLSKGKRHHVHLSANLETAQKVGARRGRPVILKVMSGQMHRDGHLFYCSQNGVWLTDKVPPQYLEVISPK
ncbi:MAG: RNA 2'-phosphotransferase [Blastocatellia bacterium]|nr:RNA 2'-phosphotransferase [Blastocatellia bacterium]